MMTTPPSSTATPPAPAKSGRAWRPLLLKLSFSVVLFLVLFELAGQVLLWKMRRDWKALKADPLFYYEASSDPVLAYELKKGYSNRTDAHGRLHINRFAVRDDDESVPTAPRRIALLGDSVTFTAHHDQDQTLSAALQRLIDPSRTKVRVINFGVPGYSAVECAQFLKNKNAIYQVTDVVYLMNPNDFAMRDSRFEGADDALYRIFHPPRLATPLLLRKACYRLHKSHSIFSSKDALVRPEWYLWMFDGTRQRTYDAVRRMKHFADENDIRLYGLLIPVRSGYRSGGYALTRMNVDIAALFQSLDVTFVDPQDQFAADAAKYINNADHLEPAGNEKMASILHKLVGASAATTQNAATTRP